MKIRKTKTTKDDAMAEANAFHTPLLSRVDRQNRGRKSRMAYRSYLGLCETYSILGALNRR